MHSAPHIQMSIARRLITHYRTIATLNRPAPPPLPREQQRQFEELLRKAQTPLAHPTDSNPEAQLHPDARKPVLPEFQGDVNPKTGERGGPKNEPVRRWGKDNEDWSFKGRVSDF